AAQRYDRSCGRPDTECGDETTTDHLFSDSTSPIQYESAPSVAIPLVADRVALPSNAVGTVDLLDLLPADLAAQYAEPDRMLRPVADRVRAPRATLLSSADEYVKLVRRLQACDMVDFTVDPIVVNGLFAVPKDGDAQR